MRILLVEDDRDVAEYVGRDVEDEGCAVSVCHDGADGLRAAEHAAFDFIVPGVMLPLMDGLEVTRRLRAPMTLIYTAAQHSLRRERSREELVDSMQKILRDSRRTTALIDDLLLLDRGDAGKEPAALEITDAGPLLRDAAEQATAMAAAKDISVSLHLEADALPVRADEAQLRRLLLIFIDNALKYTPPGGRVTIQGSAGPTDVTISVADSGTGIAPDDLPHVFERFWRADKVRSREAGGTGLGLTIAKQIADLHGARLGVESEIGRGSVFTIRLPSHAGQPARA